MEVHQLGGMFYDSNIYLVVAEKPIVIDCGTGGRHSKVVKALGEILEPKKVDTIVLTHRHFDHTGGAESMKLELEADLLVHEKAAPALREGDDVTTAASAFGKSFPKLEVRSISEGDEIDLGDLSLKVIHLPGHSNCSIALYHEATKTLFSGDTVYTDGGIGRWDLPTGNYDELLKSLIKLSEMEVANLYPGHGPSASGDANKHIALGLKYARMWG